MYSSDMLPEVFSVREVASAAGVDWREARQLVLTGQVRTIDGRFLTPKEAQRAVRLLTGGQDRAPSDLFAPMQSLRRRPAVPLAVSGSLHAAAAIVLVLATAVGFAKPDATPTRSDQQMRLVFVSIPGPGGGGGGGGKHEPKPPPPAERKGVSTIRSPLPIRRPPPPADPPPVVRVSDPPPVKSEPLPPIVAPVVTVPADTRDRTGVPAETPHDVESHGPGTGAGTGTGQGTGVGEGSGPGIGPGSGGGTGGGPYRPGSGITPPSVLREVKPDYTEEGRRRNLEGDVVMEIVVKRDGGVGDVKLLRGLGGGLDQRAIDAVRQWRFSPATRQGVPVDVVVEVAVEFKLR